MDGTMVNSQQSTSIQQLATGKTSHQVSLLVACCLLIAAACCPLTAASSSSSFLQLDPTSRPAALAGAYTAAAGDIDSLAYNPGGLSAMPGKQAVFTHAEWLVDTSYDYLAYGHPTRFGTFGISALRLGYGDIERRDASRMATGTFEATDSAYSLGYAHTVGAGIGVGGSIKFLHQKIDTESASSYAMDFGAVGRLPGRPLWLGASVLNVGPETRFIDQSDPLPLTFAVGGLYRIRSFKISADLRHEPNDDNTSALAGIEYSPIHIVSLRAGYRLPFASANDESAFDLENVRGGIGLQVSRFRLDYALAAFGDLGLTHRFTVSLRFYSPPQDDHNILSPDDLREGK